MWQGGEGVDFFPKECDVIYGGPLFCWQCICIMQYNHSKRTLDYILVNPDLQ